MHHHYEKESTTCLFICINYRIRKCAQTMYTTPTLSTTVYIMSILFLLSFPDFLVIFLLITILENVHIACKQWSTSVSSFSSNFPWFSEYIYITCHIRKCTQTMETVPLHYTVALERNVPPHGANPFEVWRLSHPWGHISFKRHCKQVHIMSLLFFLTLYLFSHYVCINYYIRQCAQTM